MLNFESLPSDKPNQNTVAEGRYTATVFKTQMLHSDKTNSNYLNVSFKIDNGGFVNENYFESDKPFLLYKLGRLLKACNVTLSGNGSLSDVAKVIKGKKVVIDVAINDRGYGTLDYTKDKEGIYSPSESDTTQNFTEVATEVDQAIEADVSIDEDF